MKTSDFFFELPDELIAQYPPEKRGQSRLMLLDRLTGNRSYRMVEDLPEILSGPDFRGKDGGLPLLVFNNSKVRKARVVGTALNTGAKVEFLLVEPTPHSPLPTPHSSIWKALTKRAKRKKPGNVYVFFDNDGAEIAKAEITVGEGDFRHLAFDRVIDDDWLDRYGHIPLPPYIKRQDAPSDSERYQTVYASAYGSSAAPTAGLHFTNGLLERINASGIESVFITLHVGLGTFLPVRSGNIEDHVMHREHFSIDDKAAQKIETAKAAGRKIMAIGTTSARAMESAWDDGKIKRGEGATSIFIYPGYKFKVADALFTNFHTPESTLLMLVSAFAGRELILESYAEAIAQGCRFFSYGDAMLIM